jgi:FkbM family methyltransferase
MRGLPPPSPNFLFRQGRAKPALKMEGEMSLLSRIGVDRIKEHSFVPSLMQPGGTVVDLGANRGDFSMALTRRGFRCYAVEPNPALFQEIPGDDRLIKVNAAITDADGPVEFDVCDNPEASSLSALGTDSQARRIKVEGMRFDSLIDRCRIGHIDLLKVDIEGAEIRLFKSLRDDQVRRIPQITVEVHEMTGQTPLNEITEMSRRMRSLGFAVLKMSVMHYGDVLFLNRHECNLGAVRLAAIRHWSRNLSVGKRLWHRVLN